MWWLVWDREYPEEGAIIVAAGYEEDALFLGAERLNVEVTEVFARPATNDEFDDYIQDGETPFPDLAE